MTAVNLSYLMDSCFFPSEKSEFAWAHPDLNQGPTDYESAALTN